MSWEYHKGKQQLAVVWGVKEWCRAGSFQGSCLESCQEIQKMGLWQPAENIGLKWKDFGHHHSMVIVKGLEYEGKDPQFGRAQRAKVSVVQVGNNLLLYQ